MATKVKKSYDLTAREQKEGRRSKEEKEQENLEKRELPIVVDDRTISAPIIRRIIAYVIDITLCYGGTAIMLLSANSGDISQLTRLLYLLSAFMLQVLMFGIVPTEYWPGQTVGKKIVGIYVRKVADKKTLGLAKNLLRDYGYGMFGALLTIPFETLYLLFQLFSKGDNEEETNLQAFTLGKKRFVLPREMLFKDEVVYLPKLKKEKAKEEENI